MTVDRAAVVVLVLHRKRNINKMCENARGFCLLAFSLLEIGASRKQVEVGRTEGAGKHVLECKFVVSLKEAACLKLNCLCTASTGGGICPSVADIQGRRA